MKKSVIKLQLIGFFSVSVAGTLLHFLFELTGKSPVIALFSPVNESGWEHMKLVFFPMLLFAFVERKYIKNEYNFWGIKLLGILSGLISVPALYYTYNGVLGKSPGFINIAIYFVSVASGLALETKLFKKGKGYYPSPVLSIALILLIMCMFFVFTFITPRIPLFCDPIDFSYGIRS